MNRVSSIFSQMLQLFPRMEFEAAVKKHKAEHHARGFTCWGQFVAMLFCQLGHAQSLREICNGLAASEGKLKHLGVPQAPNRSTLSYANEHRTWELYKTVFHQLLERCQQLATPKKKFRFKNKLVSLDATVIDLCATVYDWAKYKRTKGAVKLHLLLDHDGYLPSFAVITPGKTHEIKVARKMSFEAGTIVVFDRGYTDYDWFLDLTRKGVWFVTRLKDSATYGVVRQNTVPKDSQIVRDEIILLVSQQEIGPEASLRRIEMWDEEKQESLVFLTNHLMFAASTIAAIYKDRWQVELFFKSIKQLLKIKTFVGTSANALRIQIWTALIASLLLRYLKLRSRFAWSLSNLVAVLRQQLFVYRDLYTWIDDPWQAPPALTGVHDAQLALPFTR
jgi:transposase